MTKHFVEACMGIKERKRKMIMTNGIVCSQLFHMKFMKLTTGLFYKLYLNWILHQVLLYLQTLGDKTIALPAFLNRWAKDFKSCTIWLLLFNGNWRLLDPWKFPYHVKDYYSEKKQSAPGKNKFLPIQGNLDTHKRANTTENVVLSLLKMGGWLKVYVLTTS